MSSQVTPEETIRVAQEARRNGQKAAISLPGVDLSGGHLASMDLTGADLEGADLTGAILAGAHLARANLKNAILIGASLDGADLTGADLRGADLAGARLDDAVLAGTRLEGACMHAVFGDPLSMTSASMDQVTIELSEFTMRDIAQMVVRGVDVNENEVIPVSLRPAPGSELPTKVSPAAVPSILPLVGKKSASPSHADAAPSVHTLITESPPADDPSSFKEVLAPLDFDRPLSSIPDIRRALGSIPPSAALRRPGNPISTSGGTPSNRISIIPSFRAAEITTRIEQAAYEQEQVPVSQRMFLQLNALIDDARIEAAPPLSLRPQKQDLKKLADDGFQLPIPGDEFLGVRIEEELPPGTTARSYRGTNAEGASLVVRVFDPRCEGAALQLPAFQRGLRALNKLQGVEDPELSVVELVAVAVDQTAYVARHYRGQSLQELLEISMTLEAGLKSISSLAKTMAAIHRQGLMVRAWKPANVLVDGLKLLVSEPDMVHLPTLSQYRGDAGGYKAYAAPEELLGRGTRSPTADVYSLGKMLEFLLTGQEPLVPLGSPPLISTRENIPQLLVDIVRRATEQEPSDRYQSVEELMTDLDSFRREGDRAVLLASLRPQVVSQLSVRPMSTGPGVADVEELIRKKIKVQRAKRPKKKSLAWQRQVELGLALIGGIGGLGILTLLVFAPRSVDSMEGLRPYLAGAIGLLALALPVPSVNRIAYRIGSWVGLSLLVAFLNPTGLAQLTWAKQLQGGTALQKQLAVQSLSRIGEKEAKGAQLDGLHFNDFDLDSLDFSGASLRGARFSGAFLVEAQFAGADVTRADFSGANLFGTNLSQATGVEDALCDEFTILPLELSCQAGYISREPQQQETDDNE